MQASAERSSPQDVLDPRFNITSPLRCDGPGSLDRGEDTLTHARIAIRWLPIEAGGEAAAAKVSQIPVADGLPKIHAKGRVGGLAYFAMDFPEGRLLTSMLKKKLSLDQVLQIGIDIGQALVAIHERGVAHGELSTHSVLWSTRERALLWDLPLVMAERLTERRGDERSLTKLGRLAPSLAPECARGLVATPASDVYALAALLCRAAGDGLPPGESTLAKVHAIGSGQWLPKPSESLPKSLQVVLSLAVGSEPGTRPAAKTFVSQLRDVQGGVVKLPVRAEEPGEPITAPLPTPQELIRATEMEDEIADVISETNVIDESMLASPPASDEAPPPPLSAQEEANPPLMEEMEGVERPERPAEEPAQEEAPPPPAKVFDIRPSLEIPAQGSLFGAVGTEEKKRGLKSPAVWVGLGLVAAVGIILAVVFTSDSHPKTPAPEAAAAAAEAPKAEAAPAAAAPTAPATDSKAPDTKPAETKPAETKAKGKS